MVYDYLIIGAGPAGLQLGYFFEKSGRNYLMVEEGDKVGGFFEKFPRHRQLISINKIHTGYDDHELNLRWDWNSLLNEDLQFTRYSERYFPPAERMVDYLQDFHKKFQLRIQFQFKVTHIDRHDDGFTVTAAHGEVLKCRRLIVATGLYQLHQPDFPGVELAERYTDCSVDPHDFRGKRVLIVGKGNSGLETAENLIETTASTHLLSPNAVKLAWASHYVGHIRAVNNNFLDTYQLKSQNVILDADIESMEQRDGQIYVHIIYTHAKGERRTIPYDHVILATGFEFDDAMFAESCRPAPAFHGKLPDMTSAWESTNVPDLFFAGTLMQMRDYKKTMSGFIHGFRYNIHTLHQILGNRYHGEVWPMETADCSARALSLKVIDRLNRSSSMFLQPGFYGDMLIDHQDGRCSYVKDLPLDYVKDSDFSKYPAYYTISLEYGDYSAVKDPFNIPRDPDPAKAHLIEYLHPIIRKYREGKLINEHHMVEDVENVYSSEGYISSIEQYLKRENAGVPKAPFVPN